MGGRAGNLGCELSTRPAHQTACSVQFHPSHAGPHEATRGVGFRTKSQDGVKKSSPSASASCAPWPAARCPHTGPHLECPLLLTPPGSSTQRPSTAPAKSPTRPPPHCPVCAGGPSGQDTDARTVGRPPSAWGSTRCRQQVALSARPASGSPRSEKSKHVSTGFPVPRCAVSPREVWEEPQGLQQGAHRDRGQGLTSLHGEKRRLPTWVKTVLGQCQLTHQPSRASVPRPSNGLLAPDGMGDPGPGPSHGHPRAVHGAGC